MKTILNYAIIAFLALAFSLKGDCMSEERPQVVMTTTLGDITVELYNDLAPTTAKNFLKYAEEGHYEGTIFHRVISGFMVQGGGMNKEMQEKKTRSPIKNEAKNGLSNKRGTVAMARTNVVDSATSQFFINVVDNSFLDYRGDASHLYGYCVFGEVVQGMDIIDKIREVKTGTKAGHQDVPLEAIEIIKVSIQ